MLHFSADAMITPRARNNCAYHPSADGDECSRPYRLRVRPRSRRSGSFKEASTFLRWVDAITHLTIAWCYSAEEILSGLAGRRIASSNAVMDRVLKRMQRNARSWR